MHMNRFQRKSSRSPSTSNEKGFKSTEQIRNFYVKNMKSNGVAVSESSNLQKMIKKKVIIGSTIASNMQHPDPKNLESISVLHFGNTFGISKQQKPQQILNGASNPQKAFENQFEEQSISFLKQQFYSKTRALEKQIARLNEALEFRNRKIQDLQTQMLLLSENQAKSRDTSVSLQKAINSNQSTQEHLQVQNQQSFISTTPSLTNKNFRDQGFSEVPQNLNLIEAEPYEKAKREIYRLKQKVDSLEIELQSQKRKSAKQVSEMREKKDKQILKLKSQYSEFLTEYKKRMKSNFSTSLKKGFNETKKDRIKSPELLRKQSIELSYSSDQDKIVS